MIYVDTAIHQWKGKLWCHLVADDIEELHDFAWEKWRLVCASKEPKPDFKF